MTGVTCGSRLGLPYLYVQSAQIPCTGKKAPISPTIVPSFPSQSSCTCIFVQKGRKKRKKRTVLGSTKYILQSFLFGGNPHEPTNPKPSLLLVYTFCSWLGGIAHKSKSLFLTHHHDVCPSCSFLGTSPFFNRHQGERLQLLLPLGFDYYSSPVFCRGFSLGRQ